jgi:hypothetical protein
MLPRPTYRSSEAEIMEQARRALQRTIKHTGRHDHVTIAAKDPARQQRALRSCHLPAEPKPRRPVPRDTGAYVPELAARLENDPNLTDGARRCARKLAEYTYRTNRRGRVAEITVTWLMKAMGRGRRAVQRYLRELEAAGYIDTAVIASGRSRLCVGLAVALLTPLFPRHHRREWPASAMNSGAPKKSQNHRFKNKHLRIPCREWAARCRDGVFRALMATIPPVPEGLRLAA